MWVRDQAERGGSPVSGREGHWGVGGAVVSRAFADSIGADGYSRDCYEAVIETRRLLDLVSTNF